MVKQVTIAQENVGGALKMACRAAGGGRRIGDMRCNGLGPGVGFCGSANTAAGPSLQAVVLTPVLHERPRPMRIHPYFARALIRAGLFRPRQLHRNMRRVADDARSAIGIVAAVGPQDRFQDQHELLGEHI